MEGGFALLDVLVASVVLLVVLVAVGSELGFQDLSVGASQAQQQAAGLLDQALEEVRALPFQIVVNGLSTTDSTVAGTSTVPADPYISRNSQTGVWTFTYDNIDETIPHGSLAYSQAPFVPHITSVTESGIPFQVAAYPTIDATDSVASNTVYRVTVIVSWAGNDLHGVSKLVGQTLVYSASNGCLGDNTHPFAAPCQPFFFTGAVGGGGSIDVAAASGASSPLLGLTFNDVELLLPKADSSAQIEQASSILGSILTTGALIDTSSEQVTGSQSASSSADNDPGSAQSGSSTGSASNSGTTTLQASGSGLDANSISLALSGSTDTGSTTSTAAASSNPACHDLSGTVQTTGLPCGSGSVIQSGTTAALTMGLFSGLSSLGTTPLVSVAPPTYPFESFVARFTTGGTYCSGTSGDGCVHAGAQYALGTVQLAGLPGQVISDLGTVLLQGWGLGATNCPAGNYLVALTNYSAQVSSESGVNAASPAISVPLPGQAAKSYLCAWNGNGYSATQVTNWGTNPPAISIPTVSLSDPLITGLSVSIRANLTAGQATTASSTPSGCSTPCTGNATVSSPIQGDITYEVSVSSTVIADLDIHVNLGEVEASTSYQAAP